MREVSIVQASATCKFPDALDGVQFRAVGGEVVEREATRAPPSTPGEGVHGGISRCR